MLGKLQLGADRLVRVLYLLTHLLVEGALDLFCLHARLELVLRGQFLAESLDADDIALFEHSVVL